jgi:hypothetical protein
VLPRFLERTRRGLAENNMLRGAWVEEIVAWYLGIDVFPGAFNYYDLRTMDGFTISIKQSVGPKARFDVSGRVNAWDCELADECRKQDEKAEGWLDNPSGLPRQWCDIWVLAHLEGEPDLERVIEPMSWRFAVVDRVRLGALPNKTIGPAGLEALRFAFVSGEDLELEVRRAAQRLGTPANWMRHGETDMVR